MLTKENNAIRHTVEESLTKSEVTENKEGNVCRKDDNQQEKNDKQL